MIICFEIFKQLEKCILPNNFYIAYNNLPAIALLDGFREFSVSNDLSNKYMGKK